MTDQVPEKPETSEETSMPDTPASSAQHKEKTTDVWAIIGKAGTVVALIVGAIAIYAWFNPRGPSIVATCTETEISSYVQESEENTLTLVSEILSRDTLSEAMPRTAGRAARSDQVLDELARNLQRAISSSSKFLLSKLRTRDLRELKCSLVNRGTEPATEVALHLPHEVVRAYVNTKDVTPSDASTRFIDLGTVPAGPAVHLNARVRAFLSLPSEDKLFINYRGGTGKVQLGRTYYGFAAKLADFWDISAGLAVLLFASLSMLLALAIANILHRFREKDQGTVEKK